MTKYFWAILLSLLTFSGFGQQQYADSLKDFQRQYIADLYKIIKDDTAYIAFYPLNKKMVKEILGK
ncbi:MAG: hypothetical protein EOP49_40130, partial [Sphingobacteriales bacterium]